MKKKFKRFLKNNALVLIALVDVVMLLTFFYMAFGFLWETAQFHLVMSSYAG